MDEKLVFSDKQAIYGAAGSVASTYAIDLGGDGSFLGRGKEIYLVIQIMESLAGGNAASNVTFTLREASAVAAGATTGANRVLATRAYNKTQLVAGQRMVFAVPQKALIDMGQYFDVLITRAGNTTTGGTATIFLTIGADTWTTLPDATN